MRPRSGLARDEGAFFKVGVLWVLPTPLERQGTLACPGGPRSRPFQRRGPIPTTSPSPAQKQADTPAEKHISLAPRRAIRYNRARNGQEAET